MRIRELLLGMKVGYVRSRFVRGAVTVLPSEMLEFSAELTALMIAGLSCIMGVRGEIEPPVGLDAVNGVNGARVGVLQVDLVGEGYVFGR